MPRLGAFLLAAVVAALVWFALHQGGGSRSEFSDPSGGEQRTEVAPVDGPDPAPAEPTPTPPSAPVEVGVTDEEPDATTEPAATAEPAWPDELLTGGDLHLRFAIPQWATLPNSVRVEGSWRGSTAVIDGTATFQELPVGSHQLTLTATGFDPIDDLVVDITEGFETRVTLPLVPEPTAVVAFEVVDSESKQPVAGALVVVLATRAVEKRTDAAGRCELQIPREAEISGYRVLADGYLTYKKFRLRDPLAVHFAVDLVRTGASVEVHLDERSRGQHQTRVAAYWRDGEEWSFVHSNAADEQGIARLSELPPGDYELRFSCDGAPVPAATLQLSIAPGEARKLDHVLP